MAAERIPVEVACRVVDVSVSGYYAWLGRPPSARAIRHAWLLDLITEVHQHSRGIYGARRVHAELRLGRGIVVGHGAVEMLMRRAGLAGANGRRRWRGTRQDQLAVDLVDRAFSRTGPDQLWVTDITEHPTREGKVYCAVVLDAYSRRVVGWSIDSSPTSALVTNALGMAIDTRTPAAGSIIHSDHGVQGEFNWWSQHLDVGVLRWVWGRGSGGFVLIAGSCLRRVVRRWPGGRTVSGFGSRSRKVCGPRRRPRGSACRRRLALDGFATLAG